MNVLFRSFFRSVSAIFDVRKKIYDLLLALDVRDCQAALLAGQLSGFLKKIRSVDSQLNLECGLLEQDTVRLVVLLSWQAEDKPVSLEVAQASLFDWQVIQQEGALWLGYKTALELLDESSRQWMQQIAGSKSRELLLLELEQQNQKLTEALAQSEVAIQAKAEFLANISHEIRTPMNAVIGYNELLAKTPLSEQQHKYVTRVMSSANHLMQIINDLLDYSRIEAGKLTLDPIPFSLNEQLEYIYGLFKRPFAEKQIRLIFVVDAGVPNRLIGDPLRVNQILINFLSNALKFTDAGTVCLNIKVIEREAEACRILFSVQDEGIGISVDKQALIFESFTQADNSTTRNYGGSGLGLSICKKLAELLSADMGVKSEMGQGATFWLSCAFPVSLESEFYFQKLKHVQQGRYNAMVVEQNQELHAVWRSYWERLKITGTVFSSVSEAVAFFGSPHYAPLDFILCYYDNPQRNLLLDAWQKRSVQKGLWIDIVSDDVLLLQAQGGASNLLALPLLFDNLLQALTQKMDDEQVGSEGKHAGDLESIPDFKGLRVLIVDDNELNREFLQQLLSEYQVDCDIAENGAIAVQKVASQSYDLVFMDLNMPVLDGISATKQIRQQYSQDQLPIVVLTANASRGDRDQSFAAGVNDLLIKPIHNEQLIAALNLGVNTEACESASASASPSPSDKIISANSEDKIKHLMQVPGLNVQNGLHLMGGSERRYLFILEKFVALKSSIKADVMEALQGNDLEEAIRRAHSLKGSARVIDAWQVSQLAEKLEFSLKEYGDDERVYPLIDELESQLQALLTALMDALHLEDVAP